MTTTPLNDRYRQMDVSAMTPTGRIVALYARVLLALRQARLAIAAGEIEAREQRLLQATDILHELAASLDHVQGGEISGRLAALYAWMIQECHGVHQRPEATRLDPVITSMTDLHEAWVEVARQVTQPPALERVG